ncbi:hydroxyacid dehydrogenase [Pusillimonas sp. ANT_WB101]|uniref:hydroxyacid dehydrogenase n=1 Tax=Pusillimonas sp. ANT_WB101 TaxID=2597356 RepID=UPI0011EF1CD4|nr:hydroxyacid dehydrogenase [Pusillimonas sp. ANT_WB101]KAA0890873.1 hydroxyacid dehydrogenase [Pusillimonas sp. ANT_WB101]
MTINVLRLKHWIDPSFDEIIRAHPEIQLSILDQDSAPEINWEKLSRTNIYHISVAKDEVPPQWQVTASLLEKCPQLRVVSTAGAGYDTVDVAACTERGVLVVNQAGGNAESVAEHTFALMLALSCRIVESDFALKHKSGFSREDLMGHELAGKVLGLVGIGHIGARVAELASAFRMKVLAFDPHLDDATIRSKGGIPSTLSELLHDSDIVSLHCPRTTETKNMFGASQFDQMKKGALFISTARGGIHDEDALYHSLISSHLGGAGLDVWFTEPPSQDHPLLTLPNVVSTYHTAGVTHEGRRNIATISAQQIVDICFGRKPPRMINAEVYPEAVSSLV